jgi:hypothetical protein
MSSGWIGWMDKGRKDGVEYMYEAIEIYCLREPHRLEFRTKPCMPASLTPLRYSLDNIYPYGKPTTSEPIEKNVYIPYLK